MGAMYVYTLQPSLAWGDGTRLQREVITGESFILTELVDVDFAYDPLPFARLGVAAWDHPLYVMVGHLLVSSLPTADPLWLVNVMSAIFGAASLVVFFKLLFRHTKSWMASLFATLALALSHTFWWHAVTPEVYTLFAFLLLSALYAFDAYLQTGSYGALVSAVFLVGLGAANHLLAFLMLPAGALCLLIARRTQHKTRPSAGRLSGRLDARSYFLLLALFLIGLSPYWVQLLRVLRTFSPAEVMGPAVGATFIRGSLAFTPAELTRSVASYLVFLFYQFGPLGTALGIFGWWQGRSHYLSLWRIAAVFYTVYLLFGIVYGVSDQFAFFLAAHVFWAMAIGMGTARAEAALANSLRWALAGGLVLALLLVPLVYEAAPGILRSAGITDESFGIPRIGTGARDGLAYYLTPDKSGDTGAYDFGLGALSSVPEETVIVAEWFTDTDEYFVFRYLTTVEKLRADVEIIGWPLEDPFAFDPRLAIAEVESVVEDRPVYLASLSEEYYAASTVIGRYCVVPEHGLYRVYPREDAVARPCLTPEAAESIANTLGLSRP
jgi:hypothetical protein